MIEQVIEYVLGFSSGWMQAFFGGIAALGLLFQLERNFDQMREAAVDSSVAALRAITTPYITNPEASRIFAACVVQSPNVTRAELAQFAHMAFQFFKAAEVVHYYRTQKRIKDEQWNGWEGILHIYLTSPGMLAYWKERQTCFSQSFNDWVMELSETKPPNHTAGELFESPGCGTVEVSSSYKMTPSE